MRGFTPGEQRPGHLTGTIRRDLKLMNTRTTENGKAAQQIIKALALPTASRAPVTPRPLPLSRVPLQNSLQVPELRFGLAFGLGQDRGSCPSVCCI
jgi:hypothetical protein